MGVAKKKKTKTSKNYIWKDTKSVSDRLKKGQIPYVDFYPLKTNLGAKKDHYIIIDPKKPINLRADRQDKWENIPEMARNLYDTPFDAMEALVKGAAGVSNKDENRFILCCHIECDWKEKENKNLSLNALIDKNLENYCMFIGVPYSNINLSVRELQKKNKQPDKNKEDRQDIIDLIVERHRRLVKQQPGKFKKWMRDNEAYYRGPF